MSPIRLSAILVVLICTLLASSGSASAVHHEAIHHPASFSFEADLPSADGYGLILRASDHHRIELAVQREPGAEPYVTMFYRVRGHVGRHGIEADLGRFGRVEMHFIGRLYEERFRFHNCRGRAAVVSRYGDLRGIFRFEALDPKITSTVYRAKGQTREEPARTCTPKAPQVSGGGDGSSYARRPVPAEGNGEGLVTGFSALTHADGRTVEIYAFKLNDELGGGIISDMAATSTRRFGRVLVSTSVHAPESEEEVPGEDAEFTVLGKGTRPRRAILSAPAPFLGDGTYLYRPGSAPTFLGTLSVHIPGEGTVPLAGPGFRAALCNYAQVKLQRACEATAAPPHTFELAGDRSDSDLLRAPLSLPPDQNGSRALRAARDQGWPRSTSNSLRSPR